MKVDLQSIDQTQFVVVPHAVAGETCYLVTPQRMGVDWTHQNKVFRSSLWNSDGELISSGFPKFCNWGEKPETFPLPNSLKGTTVVEKLDGCCEGNTIILTEDGEKTVKEICETEYKGKALGLDHNTGKQCFTKIISHSIKPNNDDWHELCLVDGKTLRLTGNHEVFIPKLNCYRRVDQLNGDEEFLLKK